ncbi:hypothetical protein MLD38_037376 [Melastoma candidum]|uniref:Uncharacterized protein n=1 Tax=Melastoma candidum TaxID=119954 RepID=A0ACB9LMH4_9MYRT|nr:hypothetical protein MLD38_037376 [Melastoma candidum]
MGVILNSTSGKKSLLVKGAVGNLLERSSGVQLADGSVVELDSNSRRCILQSLNEMTTESLRCLGLAYKNEWHEFESFCHNREFLCSARSVRLEFQLEPRRRIHNQQPQV